MNKKQRERIEKTLSEATGNPTDIYGALYMDMMKDSEEPWNVLRAIVAYQDEVGAEDDAPERMSVEKRQELEQIYYPLLRELARVEARKNQDEDTFYQALYNNVFARGLFPTDDDDVAVVLLELLAQKVSVLPYRQMKNLLIMSSEEYRDTAGEILPQINLALNVLNRHLETRTEEVSQLWELAATLKTREQQIVYWAIVIDIIRDAVENAYS